MKSTQLSRSRKLASVVAIFGVLAASCSAQPGPAPTVDPTTTPAVAEPGTEPGKSSAPEGESQPGPEPGAAVGSGASRTRVGIGIQPLRNGLNPHLLADTHPTVDTISELTLPSAFNHGHLNTDLLKSAEESLTIDDHGSEERILFSVRYEIAPTAQWSDGTPITGADFSYLHRAMTTTPGVVADAGYRLISRIEVSDSGRMVEVHFTQPYAEWRQLFTHLLPSHLVGEPSAFGTALGTSIPASGARYLLRTVDRARGNTVLNRNDRFWGPDPARIDVVELIDVRNPTQGTDLLRSEQISTLDVVPDETSSQRYRLLPGTSVHDVEGYRQLEIELSVNSPILGNHARRAELLSLLDREALARLAAGRSADVALAEASGPVEPPEHPELARLSATQPLRIGADAADRSAVAGARAMVDMLGQSGISARYVSTDIANLADRALPNGEVDIVVTWRTIDESATTAASRLLCPADGFRGSNLSGYCTPETDERLYAGLAGEMPAQEVRDYVRKVSDFEHLTMPLLIERRLWAIDTATAPEATDGRSNLVEWISTLNPTDIRSTPHAEP